MFITIAANDQILGAVSIAIYVKTSVPGKASSKEVGGLWDRIYARVEVILAGNGLVFHPNRSGANISKSTLTFSSSANSATNLPVPAPDLSRASNALPQSLRQNSFEYRFDGGRRFALSTKVLAFNLVLAKTQF
ncbi:hypothetical protein [Haliscomenobacter sp.]|uniref:hypothetical protein n=1 Tax=Haliscomenobacter sp. TaxID=2717303 RepID=UPI003BAB0549